MASLGHGEEVYFNCAGFCHNLCCTAGISTDRWRNSRDKADSRLSVSRMTTSGTQEHSICLSTGSRWRWDAPPPRWRPLGSCGPPYQHEPADSELQWMKSVCADFGKSRAAGCLAESTRRHSPGKSWHWAFPADCDSLLRILRGQTRNGLASARNVGASGARPTAFYPAGWLRSIRKPPPRLTVREGTLRSSGNNPLREVGQLSVGPAIIHRRTQHARRIAARTPTGPLASR